MSTLHCRPDDVRADGGPRAAAHLGQDHGPQAHQPPPPLHAQRPLQQAATHRGDAQARSVVIGSLISSQKVDFNAQIVYFITSLPHRQRADSFISRLINVP